MEDDKEAPRRIRLDLNTPAELAIYNAMQEVEKAGADIRLTHAVIKLGEARNHVADFVDGVDDVQWEARDKRQVNSQEWKPVSKQEAEISPLSMYEYRKADLLKSEVSRLKEENEILKLELNAASEYIVAVDVENRNLKSEVSRLKADRAELIEALTELHSFSPDILDMTGLIVSEYDKGLSDAIKKTISLLNRIKP